MIQPNPLYNYTHFPESNPNDLASDLFAEMVHVDSEVAGFLGTECDIKVKKELIARLEPLIENVRRGSDIEKYLHFLSLELKKL